MSWLVALALSLLMCPVAWARPSFTDAVPNSDSTELSRNGRPCIICHESPKGGEERNSFGRDFADSGGWSDVFHLDSDGDGQSNGLELGDPNGVWQGGTPERTTDLSLPGDPDSLSFQPKDAGVATPDAEAPDDVGPVDGGSGSSADTGAPPDAGRSDAGPTDPSDPPELGPRDSPLFSCRTTDGSAAGVPIAALVGAVYLLRRPRRSSKQA